MAQAGSSRYNRGVSSKRPLIVASLLALGVALLTLVPYLLASRMTAAGHTFSGFLINPLDGFSYLAKMRQGAQGSWLFTLPYAAEPGPPALTFTFYLFLGHLASWLHLSTLAVFHAARLLSFTFMGLMAFLFLRRCNLESRWVWVGYALVLFGSGLGWIAGPLGLLGSDLLIPESIPFAAGLVNPHFPFAFGLVAAAGALALRPAGRRETIGAGFVIGLLLGAILPFAALSLLAILLVWKGVEWWIARPRPPLGGGMLSAKNGLIAALAVGSLPWIAYDYWLTRSHAVLAIWNAQNQTPSPPPWSYVAGFGLPLAFAVVGAWGSRAWSRPAGRLLITWVVVNALLLYAPFNLQRRFTLGLFLPLAALAAYGLQVVVTARPHLNWLPSAVVLLSLPSNLILTAAGVSLAAAGSSEITLTAAEAAGYRWAAGNLHGSPLLLAASRTGNRLPAFADVRVLIGHPFETPASADRQAEVEALYRRAGEPGWRDLLEKRGIDYVVVGPYESDLLADGVRPNLTVAYRNQGFMIYSVGSP